MIRSRRWEWYVSAHIFCGPLERYSCCTQCEWHLYWPATGIWPVWRNLTRLHLVTSLTLFVTALTHKPGWFSSWKVYVGRQIQYEFPCIPVHSCIQICTSTEYFAEKEQQHQSGLVIFIWKDDDAWQTPRDAFSSTLWGFSYMSPINIKGTQAAKSTCIALKKVPLKAQFTGAETTQAILPPGLLLPWSMKRAKYALWLIKPFHSTQVNRHSWVTVGASSPCMRSQGSMP